jgi:hypothetical protein
MHVLSLLFSGFVDREARWTASNSGALFRLASFTNYDNTTPNEPVILNLGDQYYVNYNKAELYNFQTEEKANQVVVTQVPAPGIQTNGLAGIDIGGSYVISNFQGTQDLHIKVCRKESGSGGFEIMVVSVALDQDVCNAPPTPPVAPAPVSSPVKAPNPAPSVAASGKFFFPLFAHP